MERVNSDAGPLWIPADDGVMLPYIRTYGNWEPEEGDLLTRLGSPDMVFVDIGASFGYFSCLLGRRFPTCTIHTVEPHPTMATLSELNTWSLGDRVRVWRTAAGAERGVVGLTVAATNVGDIRVDGGCETSDVLAPVTPIDQLVAGRVDLVKVDTQGFETEVVSGMQRVIAENPTILIVAEFWPAAIRDRGLTPEWVLNRYRSMELDVCLVRDRRPMSASNDEIVLHATGGGSDGQATILLRHVLR